MSNNNESKGLAGIIAGASSICTVGKEGMGLNYRGYSIIDLAENATFEGLFVWTSAHTFMRGVDVI